MAEFFDCTFAAVGTVPNNLFTHTSTDESGAARFFGCDFSALTSKTLVGDQVSGSRWFSFAQCKFASTMTVLAAQSQATPHVEAFVLDCSDGDTHFSFGYYNGCGSVVTDDGIYANDGAEWSNGTTNPVSWKIVGTANATIQSPFMTPWISVHNEGTSAITPSVECVRSGSATKYKDSEFWSEWTAKVTSGSTKSTMYSDRVARVNAAGSDQAAGALDGSGWTGENATSAFMKLAPTSSFTPAELGDISVRFGVVGAITVYVDPQIRGLS
jgi:hypothetical protein